jgi:hypothetical protein
MRGAKIALEAKGLKHSVYLDGDTSAGCLAWKEIEIGKHIADTDAKKIADRPAQGLAQRLYGWKDCWAGHILISANSAGKFTETNSAALKSC